MKTYIARVTTKQDDFAAMHDEDIPNVTSVEFGHPKKGRFVYVVLNRKDEGPIYIAEGWVHRVQLIEENKNNV